MNPVVRRISTPKSTCIERRVGERVTAVVVPTGCSALTGTDMLALLEGRLAKFKQRKRVLFVDELPRNAMGKVQKNLLRDRFAGLCDQGPVAQAGRKWGRAAMAALPVAGQARATPP